MAEKNKKKDTEKRKKPAPGMKPENEVPDKAESPAAPASVATAGKRGSLRRRKPRRAPPSALAAATNTRPIVLAAVKAAYGWTDRTPTPDPSYVW